MNSKPTISIAKFEIIENKSRYYKFKPEDLKYTKLIQNEQVIGYSYILSEVCWDLLFHRLDLCCHDCREWFGCNESKKILYLWF